MFAFEIKKMMRIGRFALILYFAISLIVLFATDVPDNADMETHKAAYSDALANVQGALTGDKEAWLNEQSDERANERGFDVIYDQYLHVHENPANRYFLYTNGWGSLLSENALNIPLLALVLLLVTPVFCGEYTCGMEMLSLTAKRGQDNTRMKLLLVLAMITLVCVADAGMRYGFFAVKYGLPNGGYPLQSLVAFGASEKTLSLTGGFLLVSALRWFGAIYLSAVILFVSVLTRKAAPTVFLSAATVILPYMGLSAGEWYSAPMPLPFLLGNGFLSGSEYVMDFLTGEIVPVFLEVSVYKLAILVVVSALLCVGCIVVLLKKHRNVWGAVKKRHSVVSVSFLLIFTLMLSGCGKTDTTRTIPYSSEAYYETAEIRYYIDHELGGVFMEDLKTGEVTALLSCPLSVMSNMQIHPMLYRNGNKVYCMMTTTDAYIDRVGTFAGSVIRVSVIEIDTENFTQQAIFERDVSEKSMVLGLEIPASNEWQFLTLCTGLGVDDNYLYFVAEDVRKVSRA
ncbi:MAG: hypothetical protein LBV27_10015, partial [Oscillospiraceae bacterium]|nr:hypothetical protein [Oscillospiraceae bacterium]